MKKKKKKKKKKRRRKMKMERKGCHMLTQTKSKYFM